MHLAVFVDLGHAVPEDRGWGMQNHITKPDEVPGMDALAKRVAELEQKLAAAQSPADKNTRSANHGSVDYFDLCGICLGDF
jgi:hypothetical protein